MSQKKSRKRLKTGLILVVLSVLTGCSTIEIAHEPLKCIDRPIKSLSERVNTDELLSLSDKTFDGIEAHIIAHKERIKSQCELINRHNEEHKGK